MIELQVEMDASLFTPRTGPLSNIEELFKQQLDADGAEAVIIPEEEVRRRRCRTIIMALDEELQASFAGLSTLRVIRKSRATLDPVRRTFVPLPPGEVNHEEEKSVFVVVTHVKLLEMVESKTLLRTMRAFRECMGYETHQIVLLTYGLETHFRARSQASNREYTERIRNNLNPTADLPRRRTAAQARQTHVTREELDMELVRLRIAERCYVTKMDKEYDLLPWMMSMIRDIAIRPYKYVQASFARWPGY